MFLNDTGGADNRGSITVYPPDANGNVAPKSTIADGVHDKQTQLNTPRGLALDSAGNIYVTNASGIDTITIYAAGKFGNVAPINIISGAHTGLNLPHGIGVDSDGKIYVSNDGSDHKGVDTVTVYAPGGSGNVKPIATDQRVLHRPDETRRPRGRAISAARLRGTHCAGNNALVPAKSRASAR